MSLYLAIGVILFVLPWNLYWLIVRPARKTRHQAELEAAAPAEPAPLPKIPADETRPYLADRSGLDNPQDPRLSTCPICGMTDPGNLDAAFMGWPAHSECKEWLGFWAPRKDTGRIQAKKPPETLQVQNGVASINEVRGAHLPPHAKPVLGAPFPPSAGTTHFMVTRHFPREGAPDLWEVRCGGGAVFVGTEELLTYEVDVHIKVGCRPERRRLS